MPNALLVYPEMPPSYWGFKYALDFVGKRSAMPPLGLLTVAAMFPADWPLRVVDMNVRPLTDEDLRWTDVVLTSTMVVQAPSLHDVIQRCNRAGKPIVCGGPHATSFHEEISAPYSRGEGVDHFVLGEAEEAFPSFLRDLRQGTAQRLHRATGWPDITRTPLPRHDLIDLSAYGSMAVQFSRGCPFDCEFCDITKLYGRVPRTKSTAQVIAEMDLLRRLGWRGAVFVVDDNFIGDRRAAMELLREAARWQVAEKYPFSLFTEASVNVASTPGMLDAMADAGFAQLFIGIESPNDATLAATRKGQNTSRKTDAASHLLQAVREVQGHGIEVAGGFIVGLDGDTEFDSHVEFIQAAGIPMAMTGLLTALKGTDLHARLQREGRLLGESTGNNTDVALNFVPRLPAERLVAEYGRVVSTLYEPTLSKYFERCWTLLRNLKPHEHWVRRVTSSELMALPRSLWRQVLSRQGPAYLRFLARVLSRRPRLFPEAVRLAVMGYHFEKVTSHAMASARSYVEAERAAAAEAVASFGTIASPGVGAGST
jgi:radical SAM superfamily enzyme YgiQ (UPF0313 family)